MLRLVSFDLDGTLIHPAIFNAVADPMGFGDKLEETTRAYFEGRMSADETFRADYKHFVGREVVEMHAVLRESAAWTPRILQAIDMLHDAGLRVAVTTDQPDFLVKITQELFGVDDLVCSPADVLHGRVAGAYDLRDDKWANLQRLLKARGIAPNEVAHVGNGSNDVPIFQRAAFGLAVWPMNDAVRKGAHAVIEKPSDMVQIADVILARARSQSTPTS